VDQLLALYHRFSSKLFLTLSTTLLTVYRLFTERAEGDNIYEEGFERNFSVQKWDFSVYK
jgi:hypothetical protein